MTTFESAKAEIENNMERIKSDERFRVYMYGEIKGRYLSDKLTVKEVNELRVILGVTVDEADDLSGMA